MTFWLIAAALLGQASEPSLAKEAESRVRAATVRVSNLSKKGAVLNAVAIDRSDRIVYLLSAAHGFDENDRLEVLIFPPSADLVPDRDAEVVKSVEVVARTSPLQEDLALLRITLGKDIAIAPLKLASPRTLPVRRPFAAFSVACNPGFGPESRPEVVLDGLKVHKGNAKEPSLYWKTKQVPQQGRSGGPLVDAQGRLLGICSGNDGKFGYYTHINEIITFIDASGLTVAIDPK